MSLSFSFRRTTTFIQFLVLSSMVLYVPVMWPEGTGQCNVVPALNGYNYDESFCLQSSTPFPALTLRTVLPAASRLLQAVSSPTLAAFSRALLHGAHTFVVPNNLFCHPSANAALPQSSLLKQLLLSFYSVTNPSSNFFPILNYFRFFFHIPLHLLIRSEFSSEKQEVFVPEVLNFFTLFRSFMYPVIQSQLFIFLNP